METDTGDVYRLLSDMNVIRYMLFPLFTEQNARAFVAGARSPRTVDGRQSFVRAIAPAAGGDLLGLCGLVIDRRRQDAEAWYLLDPRYWGKGLTTAAVRELLAAGFGALGLHRIYACCVPENPASARVLEKAGMRQEGYSLKSLPIHGAWHDSLLYAMLAEEWRGRFDKEE